MQAVKNGNPQGKLMEIFKFVLFVGFISARITNLKYSLNTTCLRYLYVGPKYVHTVTIYTPKSLGLFDLHPFY